ncbi:hypothetical protein [Polymorphobacter sp.]|uniref:hypothetical protein n=1 Tax=Polymorphobacter sp. TaxID=1909290 RepID=UPI003F712D65
MADPDDVIARNAARLDRLARGEAGSRARSRRRQRAAASVKRRLVRSTAIAGALILGLILWGLIIGPIGTTVLVLAVLLGILAVLTALFWSPAAAAPKLDEASPAALPAATEQWLDQRRPALPALAAPRLDAISEQLMVLDTQLAAVPAASEVAQDLDRLLKRHLPELVDRYTRVPASQRNADLEASLVSGLAIVEGELARASEQLSQADRDAVQIQRRFLESRYVPPGSDV